jgi:DNA-binding transcriptional ArsR family regulator
MTGLPTVRVFEDDPSLLERLVSSNTPGVTNVTDDGLVHRLAREGQRPQPFNPAVPRVLAAEVLPMLRDGSEGQQSPTVLRALSRQPGSTASEISGATGLSQQEVAERLGVLAALGILNANGDPNASGDPNELLYSLAPVRSSSHPLA